MEYPMRIYQVPLENGQSEWCVEFIDLPECVGGGNTPAEAIADAQETKKVYLECLAEEGIQAPKPTDLANLPSGKIALRVSRSTHKKLIELAKLEGVSLNTYINIAISEKLGEEKALQSIRSAIKSTIVSVFNSINFATGYTKDTSYAFTKSIDEHKKNVNDADYRFEQSLTSNFITFEA